jgi:DNA polymerase-3 subunit alpha
MSIPVGPARGSGGGSLISWSLGITAKHLDPVKHGLLFERFLNPGRVRITLDYSADMQALNI